VLRPWPEAREKGEAVLPSSGKAYNPRPAVPGLEDLWLFRLSPQGEEKFQAFSWPQVSSDGGRTPPEDKSDPAVAALVSGRVPQGLGPSADLRRCSKEKGGLWGLSSLSRDA